LISAFLDILGEIAVSRRIRSNLIAVYT
jgi:hypothetical protein